MPDWAILIRAAKYLGVAPWELLDQPQHYLTWAIWHENTYANAAAQEQKRNQRRSPKHK